MYKKASAKQWALKKLREHPQQAQLFGDVLDEDLAALAEHMDKHGQQDAIEILPDGTIISGHQRVRAARTLGWKVIEVIVRHDLAEAGPAAVEARLIDANFVRRQLSPLGRARCITRLWELEKGRSARRFGPGVSEALKATIAARMHLSCRSVSRYLLVLAAPAAVQEAFDRGQVSLTCAGKVALLSPSEQAQIAKRIDAGETAAKVIIEHLTRPGADGNPLGRSLQRLVAALRREVPALRGRATEIDPRQLALRSRSLLEALAVIHELVDQVKPEYG
jgi:ParB family chromosome partitioning protein